MVAWASAKLRNRCSLRHSSRKRLLKDSDECVLGWLARRDVVPVEPSERPIKVPMFRLLTFVPQRRRTLPPAMRDDDSKKESFVIELDILS
jgi:hypothetical protein